jgi:NDP-sugar pyrophosphorylase family protein
MQAVILAAGRGSRLHPLTLERSKAMLPIAGKPMVRRILENIAAAGIRDFIVVANPQDQELIRYIEGQEVYRIQLVFQPHPRGAADGLQCAAERITGDFLLSACDNLVPLADMRGVIERWQSGAAPHGLLALLPIPTEKVSSAGIVELAGEWVTRIVEKPPLEKAPSNIASLPLYCFTPDLLNYLPRVGLSSRGEYELQDAIQMLIEHQGGVRGVEVHSRMTLTDAKDLLRLNRLFLEQPSDWLEQPSDWLVQPGDWLASSQGAVPSGTQLIPPVFVEPGVRLSDDCTIGPEAYLEAGCTIGARVTIKNSVVLRGGTIPDEAYIDGQVIA